MLKSEESVQSQVINKEEQQGKRSLLKELMFGILIFLGAIIVIDLTLHVILYRLTGKFSWQFTPPASSNMVYDNPYIPYLRSETPGAHHGQNKMGFRGKDVTLHKQPDEIRILVWGGSTSVDHPEFYKSWPGLLEQKLSELYPDKEIVVLVQAHGAYFTSDNLVFYVLRAQDYHFDLVIVYDGWNDMTPSYTTGFMSDYSHSRARPFSFNPFGEKISALIENFPYLKYSGTVVLAWHQFTKIDFSRFNTSIYKTQGHPTNGIRGVDTFRRNLETVAKLAKENGSKILFISHVELTKENLMSRDSYLQHIILQEHNNIGRQIGTTFPESRFFDFAAIFPQEERLFRDRIHFSEVGSELAASEVFEYLKNNNLVEQWNKNNFKRSVIFALSDLDQATPIGPYQGQWPPKLVQAPAGDMMQAVLWVRPHPDSQVETGLQIPLGYLPEGKYRINIGMGYDASAYNQELTKGGGVKFIARMVSNGNNSILTQETLLPGQNYTVGEFTTVEVEFSVEEGDAALELLTSLEGEETNNSMFWTYPIIHLEHD